jgi:hypothetical protein
VEPELVAAATHLGKHVSLHPTKATPGEQLPDDLYRCSSGFLINKKAKVVILNEDKVKKEMEFYQTRVIIAYFVGGRQSVYAIKNGHQHSQRNSKRIARLRGI